MEAEAAAMLASIRSANDHTSCNTALQGAARLASSHKGALAFARADVTGQQCLPHPLGVVTFAYGSIKMMKTGHDDVITVLGQMPLAAC